ncbi:MAG: hypothetical protein Q9195_009023 [Heterodermia aff. obscurata]
MNAKFQAFRERSTVSSIPKHPHDSELQDIAKCFVGLVSDAMQKTPNYVAEEANAPYCEPLATRELSIRPGFTSNPIQESQLSDFVPDKSEPTLELPTRYDDSTDDGKINGEQSFNAVSSQSMLDVEQYFTNPTHNLCDVPGMLCSRTDDFTLPQIPAKEYDPEEYQVELTDVFKIPVSPQLAKELALPSSYSFHETSFTRRLMRSSLEAAYITMLNPKPQDMDRLCTYSFCFLQKPKLMAYFKALMARSARENLELWSVPLYHVGNAGLHYPRDGIDASSPPPAWWAQTAPMGPSLPRRGLTPIPDSMTPSEIVDYAGVGGEWFDSNDVEQYLRTRGLKLDAQSSWVEIIDSSGEDQGAAYQGHPQTVSFPSTAFHELQLPQGLEPPFTGYTTIEPNDYADTRWTTDTTDFIQLGPNSRSTTDSPLQMTDIFQQENSDLFTNMWSTKPKQMFDMETFLRRDIYRVFKTFDRPSAEVPEIMIK